jgi:hypothetical protein
MALYDSTPSEHLQWAIANTLALAPVVVSEDWLVDQFGGQRECRAHEMLVLALPRVAKRTTALGLLRRLLPRMPGHVAPALAEIGEAHDAKLLRETLPYSEGWARKEIEKALRKIDRRIQA